MPRPRFKLGAVADAYADARSRILEFSNGVRSAGALKGGLIEARNQDDGTLHVSAYRLDPGVLVSVSTDSDDPYLSVLQQVTRAMLAVQNDNPQATAEQYRAALIRSLEV